MCLTQEVAVKKFLDQDFYGVALDEFRSEVLGYCFLNIYKVEQVLLLIWSYFI